MAEKTKHIFPSLDPKEEFPHEELLRGTGLKETKARVLKRMILEIIPKIQTWTKENLGNDPQALKVIEEIKRNKSSYEQTYESAWNQLLEDLTGLTPEVHLWKNPPEGILWMADPAKNPFARRAAELENFQDEETLLIGWHQYCGVIACEVLQGKTQPIYQRNSLFPEPRTILKCQIPPKGESQEKDTKLEIWAWDKRNFKEKN